MWREATPAAPTPKDDDPEGGRTVPASVRPLQGRSLFCHIPAGGAFRATQRLSIVGQLRRPFASVRVLRPCVSTYPTSGGHVGPPLHRVDTLGNIHIPMSCRGRPMCLPCARPFAHSTSFRYRSQALIWTPASGYIRAHDRAYGCSCVVFQAFVWRILMSDIGNSITDIEKTTSDLENSMSDIGNGLYLHFHIGKQDGETVPQEITAVWREMRHLRQSTPKDDDPEGGRTVPASVRPLQGRSLFRHIPAGGAFRATQRLAFVGQLRRPSAFVCVLRPIPGGHTGPPLHNVVTP